MYSLIIESSKESVSKVQKAKNFFASQWDSIKRSKYLLLILFPGLLYYIIFDYAPLYGIIIAFKDFNFFDGVIGSPWADKNGMGHFIELFSSAGFYKLLWNTVILSIYQIIFYFPTPIILALSLNEVKNGLWKRIVQTVSYLPHFISTVVICGMIYNFLSLNGVINQIIAFLGLEKIQFLLMPEYFRSIYITTDIWQKIGWGSIIYLASLSGVDTSLYEAAKMDGANRWHQIIHINIPAIIPTAIVLLIFSIGGIMTSGFEKVLLLYNPNTYETADVIGTYVYRRGILGAEFSFTTAVGLFQSIIGFIMILGANRMAKKVSEISLW